MQEDHKMTDDEKDQIAELAAQKAYNKFYQAVGKSVVKKSLWLLGAGCAFVWFFIHSGSIPK